MTSWGDFEAAAPELAALGRALFLETQLTLVGSLRRDGWPRISPVEPLFFSGELYLGMMWQSRKALDLRRDSRCTVMSTVHDRMIPDGEFKLFGRAVEVTDPGERTAYESALYEQLGFSPTDTGDTDDDDYHLSKSTSPARPSPRFRTTSPSGAWRCGGRAWFDRLTATLAL